MINTSLGEVARIVLVVVVRGKGLSRRDVSINSLVGSPHSEILCVLATRSEWWWSLNLRYSNTLQREQISWYHNAAHHEMYTGPRGMTH